MSRPHRRRAAQPTPPPNAPSRERAQHDRITLAERQIVDSLGGIGLPHVVETPLARLYRHGAITESELAAADEFRRLYRLAYLDPLRAATLEQRVIGTHLPDGSEASRRHVRAILALLGSASGSLMASCAEHVIGSEETVAEWARGKRWRGDISLTDHAARGVLLATLQALPAIIGAYGKKSS